VRISYGFFYFFLFHKSTFNIIVSNVETAPGNTKSKFTKPVRLFVRSASSNPQQIIESAMSFLAGRLAGKEGAFFFQESKHAVNRLAEKSATTVKNLPPPSSSSTIEHESQADVLPEVLRHSLPSKIFGKPYEPSSLSTSSKWALRSDHPNSSSTVSPDVLNPLRAYVSLPQVTFGPKRYTTHLSINISFLLLSFFFFF